MLHVLIIEDDPSFGDILGTYLRLNHYRVDVAQNGLSGIRLLERNRYDAVFTDIRMPLVDGNQVAKYIRQNADSQPLVVGMSGTAKWAEKRLFAAVLEKPFSLGMVAKLLHSHLDSHEPLPPGGGKRCAACAQRPH